MATLTIDLGNLPKTSPFATTVACADGAHEGTHNFKGINPPCTDCGKGYQDPIHSHNMGSPCSGNRGQCNCLCHPANQAARHWHLVNAKPKMTSTRRTVCLGHSGLRSTQAKESLAFLTTDKSYLKRMDGNEDDACYEHN